MKRVTLLGLCLVAALAWGQTVDYETQIQPIFNSNCVGCHGSNGGLSLAEGQSYGNLVAVVSHGYAPYFRVEPGNPDSSVLYNKVAGTGLFGQTMPVGGSLSAAEIALIRTWIEELSQVPITIAQARSLPEGDTVTVAGIVTTPNFATAGSRSEYGLQDPTAGIIIYTGAFDAGLQLGDSVEVTGVLTSYNGKKEIHPYAPEGVTVVSSGNPIPPFQDLTLAEILLDPESYESELVRVDSVTIVSGNWPNPGNNSNLTITDPSGATLTMRVDKDTDVDEGSEPVGYFVLHGILGQYDSSEPYDEGYQILPRFYTDIQVIGDPPPVISDVTFSPGGPTPNDAVTVTATVTDNGMVVSVDLNYLVDGSASTVSMTASGDTYTGEIPPQPANSLVSFWITATDDAGGTSSTDTLSYVVYGGQVTAIADIQQGNVPTGTVVTVQGYVTAEPYAFYPPDNLHYYFIQDAEAPWSGIKVYDPGRAMQEGDEVRLTGTVSEYYDMTEITDVTDFEILTHGNVVQPMVVGLDTTDWEAYEGCLIRIENVTVSSPDLGYGEWSITDGTDSLRVDDAADYYYYPKAGDALAYVTGVLDYSYGNYKLQPRLARDIRLAGGLTRIQAIQQVRYSDLLPHYSPIDSSIYFRDSSYFFGDTVTVRGIVTMPTGLSYAGAGVKFIFEDENGGPWSAILCYDPDSAAFPVLYEGDYIQVTGYISEYTTPSAPGSASMTELFITQEIQLLDIGRPVPEPPVVPTGDLRWPPTAEQWGNVMVKVQNATVLEDNPTPYDILRVDDGSGAILVDDDSDSLQNYVLPPPGSVFAEIRGWVYHHYGSYADSTTYKLEPLYPSDLVLATAVDNRHLPQDYALTNYPNPFNPSTTISFRLPEAADVKLIVYDLRGYQVRTLVNRHLGAGAYRVLWQGRDSQERPVASGVYLYRLQAGDHLLTGKMLLLK